MEGQERRETWQLYVEELLGLPGDQPFHVVAVLSRTLGWLYATDPAWVEEHLFSRLDAEGPDATEAFWDGFLSGNVPAVPTYMRVKPMMLARVRTAADGEALGLAHRLLAGWGTVRKGRQALVVTDQELRSTLIHGNDDFRQQVLSHLGYLSRTGKGSWKAKVPKFFRSVWPRQKAANGPRTTAAICDILMATGTAFPEVFEVVLPYLTPLDHNATRLFYGLDNLEKPKGSLVERFPALVLHLLSKVLPTDIRLWPYGARAILKRIGEQDAALATDERMLTLLRKLDMGN